LAYGSSITTAEEDDMDSTQRTTEILELVQRWADAEGAMDTATLEGLLGEDFVGVGPLGFVLDRGQWLARFGQGLRNDSFRIEEPVVHGGGDTAVVTAVQDQRTSFNGNDSSGRFRVTVVAAREAGDWRLAAVTVAALGALPPGLQGGPPRS
jgi:ketosteroid isomerase-like protein